MKHTDWTLQVTNQSALFQRNKAMLKFVYDIDS